MREVVSELVSFDLPFQCNAGVPPPDATVAALDSFWARAAFVPLPRALRTAHRDWGTLVGGLNWLAAGSAAHAHTALTKRVTRVAGRLAERDPLAASIVWLYVAASWEGTRAADGHSVYGSYFDRGWRSIPLALARSLLQTDAVWGAEFVARRAIEVIHSIRLWHQRPELVDLFADYRSVIDGAQLRVEAGVRDLAWDLRTSCAGGRLRAELAAVAWTLGDVPHAHVLTHTTHVPTLAVLQNLVRASMRVIRSDPFVQEVWLTLKDRDELDLRAHKLFFTPLNNLYSHTAMQRIDEEFRNGRRPCPSEIYAQSLVAHLGGVVSPAVRDALAAVAHFVEGRPGGLEPRFAVRFDGVVVLLLTPDEPSARAGWGRLAADAADSVRDARRDVTLDPYDRSSDIPQYHVAGDVTYALELLERRRCSNLWYWLSVVPPIRPGGEGQVDVLLRREDELMAELRGLQLIRLLPTLPAHFRNFFLELDPGARSRSGAMDSQPRALARLLEVQSEIETTLHDLSEVVPEYTRQRRAPYVGLDAFADALQVHRGARPA